MSKGGGKQLGEMLRSEVGSESWKGGETTLSNSLQESGRDMATRGSVKMNGSFLLWAVKTENLIGLEGDHRPSDMHLPVITVLSFFGFELHTL